MASSSCPSSSNPLLIKTKMSPLRSTSSSSSSLCRYPFAYYYYSERNSHINHHANKKLSPHLKPTNNEQEFGSLDDFQQQGELIDGDELYEDEEEEADIFVGDGAGGGGISLAGTEWDTKALALAEDTLLSFNGDLKIYAFKTLKNSTIQVRIEKLSNRSGSPNMVDIEEFSCAYRAQLDEAEQAGSIPENTSLEVSSPGVERVVQIPQDLDRFKDRAMYVKYVSEATATGLSSENEGVYKLVSFDLESSCCTWSIADVKINREKAGKGRPLNKKQREFRLATPFHSLRLVRIYSDI